MSRNRRHISESVQPKPRGHTRGHGNATERASGAESRPPTLTCQGGAVPGATFAEERAGPRRARPLSSFL
jgi:hypothetical protein